ncbi:MAG: XdhC family protein, partial [Lachnospiraceae bacterium]|nr:XdhC family protein [Lachnospiraceae bacterium]
MNEFYQEVKKCLAQGKEAVLATIIASSGSTPRKAGSQMLVKADGSIQGSVGRDEHTPALLPDYWK